LVPLEDASQLTRTDLYGKYVEAVEAVAAAVRGKEEAEAELTAVVREVQAKAPRILEMRRQYEELVAAHDGLSTRLHAAMVEGEAAAAHAAALETKLAASDSEIGALRAENADLSRQLQLVLHEAQRRAAAETPRQRSGGTAYGLAALRAPPPTPASGVPPPLFGMGGAGSPATPLAPAPFGGAAVEAEAPADLATPGGVISARLVPFRDVAEMQQRNAELLRAMRRLGDAHETALREKEQAASTAVAAAMAEVEELRATAAKQQQARHRAAGRTGTASVAAHKRHVSAVGGRRVDEAARAVPRDAPLGGRGGIGGAVCRPRRRRCRRRGGGSRLSARRARRCARAGGGDGSGVCGAAGARAGG